MTDESRTTNQAFKDWQDKLDNFKARANKPSAPPEPTPRQAEAEPETGWWQRVNEPAPRPTPTPDADHGGHPGRAALDFGTTTATVTLWDPGESSYPALSPIQRVRMGAAFAKLFQEEIDGPDELRADWREAATEVAQRLLATEPTPPVGAEAVTLLAERLTAADGPGPLLDNLIVEVERLRSGRGGVLRRFLTPKLHHSYEQGLRELPLDTLRYFRVFLDGSRADELDSIVYDTGRAGHRRFTLLAEDMEDPDQATPHRGLKQQLGRRVPRLDTGAGGPGLDELIGGALGDLVHRTDTYLDRERRQHNFARGKVNSVVVTYPTMVPLSVRDKLRDLLRERGVAKVETRFDEAIAAAMFFVLRELGGRFEMSVEAFAARSRAIPGSEAGGRPRAWRQNVMIVDVGGGTTDIALLEVELRDETDRTGEHARSPHYGRYFRLAPTLLGTTGETQRGGDYVTLQVFRWIKVLLADHLLRHDTDLHAVSLDERYTDPVGRYLAGKLVEEATSGLTGLRNAAEAAGPIVPTAWHTTSLRGKTEERRQLFRTLWDLAGATKIALGTEDTVTLQGNVVRELLRLVREIHQRANPSRPPGPPAEAAANDQAPFRLSRAIFEFLVSDEIRNVMHLAAGLATSRLATEPLDRVILTGRGALLPLVRTSLLSAFARQAQHAGHLRWSPSIVTPPDEYAKHAASIGACWAETVAQSVREQHNMIEQLTNGVTAMAVDVDNLFLTLRATFEVPGQAEGGAESATEIFTAGQELTPLTPGGEPVARSGRWLQYADPFAVQRRKIARELVTDHSRSSSINWASFRVEDYLHRHPIGDFTIPAEQLRELFIQVETTASLDMFALVCRGERPHIELPAESAPRNVHAALTEDGPREPLLAVPCEIVVNPNVGGSMNDPMVRPVFHAGAAFDRTLVHGDNRRSRGAAVSAALPSPEPGGWRFYARTTAEDGQRNDRLIATVPAMPGTGGVRVYAVLDEHGDLFVHAGEPPYRFVDDLRVVWENAGTVHRVPMTAADPDYNEDDDPFTGKQ